MKKTLCIALLSFMLVVSVTPVLADMMIMPPRVFFEDGDRMKTLSVINTGKAQAIYRLQFIHKEQVETGSYKDIPAPKTGEYDLSKWIVFSPRQVDMPPQGKQAIRLSLRRPSDLPDGEYRVHARLQRVARNQTNRDAGIAPPRGAATAFGVNVGFAIPVIMRKGKYDTTATIQNFQYVPAKPEDKDKRPRLAMEMHRKGKYSSMGQLLVYWTPPGGGAEKQIGLLNGANVFPELAMRTARVPLDEPVSGGTFRVVYQGTDADKGIKFDEKTFPFPG